MMHALVEADAAAEFQLPMPSRCVVSEAIVSVRAANRLDPAECSGFQERPGAPHKAVPPQIETDNHLAGRARGARDQPVALGKTQGQWLLHQYVFSGVERRQTDLCVRLGRRENRNRVHVGTIQHSAIVARPVNDAEPVRQTVHPSGVQVRRRHHARLRQAQ
jgi:hypothetical protein